MKILLISDTHGRLDAINHLAAKKDAECCFHLGDLCTYRYDSLDRFSADRLYKQLMHWPTLTPEEQSAVDCNDVEGMRAMVRRYGACGDFEAYFSGNRHFNVPIYAVPGNNDDAAVLAHLSKHPIPNLIFLNESHQMMMGGFLICGLGGSIAPDAQKVPSFGYTSTVAQINELAKRLQCISSSVPRLLLTHIPPYESPALMHLVQLIRPALVLCGHTHHWNEQTLDSGTRILTLPSSVRGYAILELGEEGHWNYHLYKVGEEP